MVTGTGGPPSLRAEGRGTSGVVGVVCVLQGTPMRPVRTETPEDHVAMHAVHTAACGRPGAAELVQALRGAQAGPLSLIAVEDGCLVGPIALSPVTLMAKTATIEARGLAPMAVLPDFQRQGIGARLVEAGLAACRATPSSVVVVLGHPRDSPRCGCTTAQREGRA